MEDEEKRLIVGLLIVSFIFISALLVWRNTSRNMRVNDGDRIKKNENILDDYTEKLENAISEINKKAP